MTTPPKKKKTGGVSYVVEFDMEDGELTDFFYVEDHHDPSPIVKPKKTVPDPDGDEDLVREEEN